MEGLHKERVFEIKESVSLFQSAEKLRDEYKNRPVKDLVLAVGKFIEEHAHSLPEQYRAKSILESRFTPAKEAFDKGMMGCGSIVNIAAEMLRHIGFRVKLIHGECEKSVDHAWISIYNSEIDLWEEYDLTRKGGDIPPMHKKKMEVNSWEEIKDEITRDHETLHSRREQRNLKK